MGNPVFSLLWSPVLDPQMVGGTLLPGAVTVKVSVRHWVFWVTGVPAAEKLKEK